MCPEPGSRLFEDTRPSDYVVLKENAYAEELHRGGISLNALTDVERFHLTTIRSDNFDMEEIARLARSLQVLMAQFPLSTYYSTGSRRYRSICASNTKYQRQVGMRIVPDNAFEFFSEILKEQDTKRAIEFLVYQVCRASLKNGSGAVARVSAFNSDMPGAYYASLRSIEVSTAPNHSVLASSSEITIERHVN